MRLIQKTKTINHWVLILVTMIVPALSYAQPAPPPGSGGSGTSPDTPLGVPFDPSMNVAFALVGLMFAIVIVMRSIKKKAIDN